MCNYRGQSRTDKGLQKFVNKKIDERWDFKKSNTKEYTHCFHSYPAMMIKQDAFSESVGATTSTMKNEFIAMAA